MGGTNHCTGENEHGLFIFKDYATLAFVIYSEVSLISFLDETLGQIILTVGQDVGNGTDTVSFRSLEGNGVYFSDWLDVLHEIAIPIMKTYGIVGMQVFRKDHFHNVHLAVDVLEESFVEVSGWIGIDILNPQEPEDPVRMLAQLRQLDEFDVPFDHRALAVPGVSEMAKTACFEAGEVIRRQSQTREGRSWAKW